MHTTKMLGVFMLICSLMISCSTDQEDDNTIDQEQLDALTGTYNLIAYQVSPAQDLNGDGTTSENLLDEINCITGTLTLNNDFGWSMSFANPLITEITNDTFAVSCSPASNSSGSWSFLNDEVVLLVLGEPVSYQLDGDTLTQTNGENLPGFRSVVFQKQ